jgi:hypothetical protein
VHVDLKPIVESSQFPRGPTRVEATMTAEMSPRRTEHTHPQLAIAPRKPNRMAKSYTNDFIPLAVFLRTLA